jgi:thioredoxin reductase (NADPH)
MQYDAIVIGGGPAGLTSGLYLSRLGLKTLLFEKAIFGGQIVNANIVENYPGFPDGISGFDLATLIHQQSLKFGLEIISSEVNILKLGKPHQIITDDGTFGADAVIIATGSQYSKLGVEGESVFMGHGVSYCATCDGYLFKDRNVAVVGGGDTAVTDALELSQNAATVYLIHRRDELRASKVLKDRALSQPKMKFLWNMVVHKIEGEKEVKKLVLNNVKTGEKSTLPVDGIFVAVGIKPNNEIFTGIIPITETGHIITNASMATSIPGIFAAGDIRENSPRQVSTGVGDGATAALSAFKYLQE